MAPKATSTNVNGSRVHTTINAVITKTDSITTIKQEQEFALTGFFREKTFFAVLTGFNKSLIYQLARLVMKKMFPGTYPILTAVAPLITLLEDQI